MSELLKEHEKSTSRPTFITVLCILTFIGGTLGLLSETAKYFTANSQSAVISKVKEKANEDLQKNGNTDEGARFARKIVNNLYTSPENIRKGALTGITAAILCLAGAFLMWHLKKTGFYLYIAGTLVGIISPFVIFGGSNIMSLASSFAVGLIGLIFVVLYGINLKYMK